MELQELQIADKKAAILQKKGIETAEDLRYLVPYKFYDFTKTQEVSIKNQDCFIAISGNIEKISKKNQNGHTVTTVTFRSDNGTPVKIFYVAQAYMKDILETMQPEKVIFCGKLLYSYEYKNFSMMNPLLVQRAAKSLSWYCVYPKYRGIGEDWLKEKINLSLNMDFPETIPEDVLNRFHLPAKKEALQELHHPTNIQNLQTAIKRFVFEDLLYFGCRLERADRAVSNGSQYNLKNRVFINQTVSNLPYDLTTDQSEVLEDLFRQMEEGRRISALIQGDVGCGKSVVAFLLMIAMAGSGFQSVLMAPTAVLANQHYEELKNLADPLKEMVVFLGGKMTAKEKREKQEAIASGKAKLIVGTHAVVSQAVEYQNLALVIIDEEHRFGVKQREMLSKKASLGVHTVSFSATPIPRSVAETIYGKSCIYEIKKLPAGRIPVQTAIAKTQKAVFNFCKKELQNGHQIYIVCPLVEDKENSSLRSVKEVAKEYENLFRLPVGIITGKQKSEENAQVLDSFKNGELKILCATTVIEVGVNVPNATVMVIEDAYMFGLSQLHQLRGRVGRGKNKGYCILKSQKDTERLNILCQSTDGFYIAEKDMELRGAGNILGEQQSGSNRFLDTALNYPNMFAIAKKIAKELVNNGTDEILISEMEKRSEKIFIDSKKIKFF